MSRTREPLRLLASRQQRLFTAPSSLSSGSHARSWRDCHDTVNANGARATVDILETIYGLQMDVSNVEQEGMKLPDTMTTQEDHQPPGLITTHRRRYRLFPDWQTSFHRNDMMRKATDHDEQNESHDEEEEEEEEEDDDDEPEVDDEVIEVRYPRLWPYYDIGRQTYERQFERQGCDQGGGAEVFPNAADRIAWDVEGLLMACWLTLQGDIESVEYFPRGKQYLVGKANIEKDLPAFLQSIWGEGAFVEIM